MQHMLYYHRWFLILTKLKKLPKCVSIKYGRFMILYPIVYIQMMYINESFFKSLIWYSYKIFDDLARFKLPTLFGGTYGARLFYCEQKCGSNFAECSWFYLSISEKFDLIAFIWFECVIYFVILMLELSLSFVFNYVTMAPLQLNLGLGCSLLRDTWKRLEGETWGLGQRVQR